MGDRGPARRLFTTRFYDIRRSIMDDVPRSAAPSSVWKRNVRRRLLAWYDKHARVLPWRGTYDPYCVWISEIMLQQTQVATVVPYYERFIARFPRVDALAADREEEVLRLWEGLGYYRRARQLHRAAQLIVQRHGGQFPLDFEDILALPGVGRYTAGAILSIARDERRPILEANSVRVLCRLSLYRDDPARSDGQRFLWSLALQLLPRKSVGNFNQALMELGSEVCTPKSPGCQRCPLAAHCPAKLHGLQASIPAGKKKTRYEDVREAAVVVRRRGRVLLRRCGADERWAGMWDFPRFAVGTLRGKALRDDLAGQVAKLTGLQIEAGRRLTTIKHSVTRFRITLLCHEAECHGGRLLAGGGSMRWVAPSRLEELPLSTTGRKIARLLQKGTKATLH